MLDYGSKESAPVCERSQAGRILRAERQPDRDGPGAQCSSEMSRCLLPGCVSIEGHVDVLPAVEQSHDSRRNASAAESQAKNPPLAECQQIHRTLDHATAVEVTLRIIPAKQRFRASETEVLGAVLPRIDEPADHPDGMPVAQLGHNHPACEDVSAI